MESKKRVRALEIYKAFGKELIYFPRGTTEKEAQMFGYERALKKGMRCSDVKIDKEMKYILNGKDLVYIIYYVILQEI